MRKAKQFFWLYIISMAVLTVGCQRSSNQFWEDSKSATRHISRGLRTMGGKHGDSRAIQYRDDFMPVDDGYYMDNNAAAMGDFIPLSDQPVDDQLAMADYVSRQPSMAPGDPGSPIPGISAFQDPNVNPRWAAIFRNINFDYNSNLIKGPNNLNTIRTIADYMKRNPGMYVFVEGHCDERGPEAFNLALGSRRSNAVRNMLIQEGVNPDNLFTISYGKERPLLYDHNEESWGQNRRAEFKIYQR